MKKFLQKITGKLNRKWLITVHYFGSGITWEKTHEVEVIAGSAEQAKAEATKTWDWNLSTHTFEWQKPRWNLLDVTITEKDPPAASQK